MASLNSSDARFNRSECLDYCKNDFYNVVQDKLDAPMPWMGMYIAAASVVCSLAMTADALKGFERKKFWFPCKYFSLNSFYLTVLAVAMKLPLDLTGNMTGSFDLLARVSTLILMSTVMCNFMTSLGSMENNELLSNVVALVILVITIVVNVCIHNVQMRDFMYIRIVYEGTGRSSDALLILGEEIGATIFMFLLLVMLCSLAIMVPTAKKDLELKYREVHKTLLNEHVDREEFSMDEFKTLVKKYWVMAETGNPQFVLARSVICVTSGMMCLLMALTMVEALIRIPLTYRIDWISSSYKWSIPWIIPIQGAGVFLGIIAPIERWFIDAKFKSSMIGHKSFKDELEVEAYWTKMLVDWRDRPLPLQVRHQELRILLKAIKKLLLSFCICVQIVIVRYSKILLLISATCAKVTLSCLHCIKIVTTNEEPTEDTDQDFSCYVVLLEGEAKLPKKTLRNIFNEVDKLIKIGKKKQPIDLIKLLPKSVNFNGVREFDSKQIKSLHSDYQEPPYCWSLPLVTLTAMAISLPKIPVNKSDQLLRSVAEGFDFVTLIEEALDRNEESTRARDAAHAAWDRVEDHKWQDVSLKSRNYTLQQLSDISEEMVRAHKENPVDWPVEVIAANSMYRISQTILLAHKENDSQTEEDLFDRLSVMISDILSACLTNLVRVITLKCRNSSIKQRESVAEAIDLLGKSEGILEILQRRAIPSLDPKKAAYIEEWRAFMEQDNEI